LRSKVLFGLLMSVSDCDPDGRYESTGCCGVGPKVVEKDGGVTFTT
jgi:hypothetical protein